MHSAVPRLGLYTLMQGSRLHAMTCACHYNVTFAQASDPRRALMHACGAQGGSFAYLTPAFAIIAQIKARGAWVDAADGTNHARFLVRLLQGSGLRLVRAWGQRQRAMHNLLCTKGFRGPLAGAALSFW